METTTLKKTISLRVTPVLYEHIKQMSMKENRSINNYIETALLSFSNFDEHIQTYSDEIGNKIIKAFEEHKASETIKITPETLWTI